MWRNAEVHYGPGSYLRVIITDKQQWKVGPVITVVARHFPPRKIRYFKIVQVSVCIIKRNKKYTHPLTNKQVLAEVRIHKEEEYSLHTGLCSKA